MFKKKMIKLNEVENEDLGLKEFQPFRYKTNTTLRSLGGGGPIDRVLYSAARSVIDRGLAMAGPGGMEISEALQKLMEAADCLNRAVRQQNSSGLYEPYE